MPSGTAKIGPTEYDVRLNASPRKVDELGDLPIKQRQRYHHLPARCGHRAPTASHRRPISSARMAGAPCWLTILKSGTASTLDVVSGIRKLLPARRHHAAARTEDRAARRSVHLRARRRERSDSRSRDRRRAHRLDDPAVPGKLAQHADHRHLDSALDPDLGDHRWAFSARPSTS